MRPSKLRMLKLQHYERTALLPRPSLECCHAAVPSLFACNGAPDRVGLSRVNGTAPTGAALPRALCLPRDLVHSVQNHPLRAWRAPVVAVALPRGLRYPKASGVECTATPPGPVGAPLTAGAPPTGSSWAWLCDTCCGANDRRVRAATRQKTPVPAESS